jgi:hypothetical protein
MRYKINRQCCALGANKCNVIYYYYHQFAMSNPGRKVPHQVLVVQFFPPRRLFDSFSALASVFLFRPQSDNIPLV